VTETEYERDFRATSCEGRRAGAGAISLPSPVRAPRRRFRSYSAVAGLTLIEIIVVLSIVAIVMGVAVSGSMQLPSARLRRSATMIASAVKVGYTRATATSRNLRLVMDLGEQKVWLEESDVPMVVQSKDTSGTGGADPITEAERAALAESGRIVKGPPIPRPQFHPIEAYGFADVETGKGGKPLQRGIQFRQVQTSHDDAPRTSGRAYLYFWPGGLTERASIQLRIGESEEDYHTLTLVVSPLMGKVTVKGGPVDLVTPADDEQASDRQDNGF
jgi:general secretion pathway protein H